MASIVSRQGGDEPRLWAISIIGSLILNILFFSWIGIQSIKSEIERRKKTPAPPEQFVTISPEMLIPVPILATPEENTPLKPKTLRTSADQESAQPPTASRRYIGQRNTQATSDRPPTAGAPDTASQKGIQSKADEIETTQSKYQDGRLDSSASPAPKAAPSPPKPVRPASPSPSQPSTKTAEETAKGKKATNPGEAETELTSIREKILGGPFPVDLPVPKADYRDDIKPREEAKVRDGLADSLSTTKPKEKTAEKKNTQIKATPKPRRPVIDDPAFRGNQRKTAIIGSISRTGRSALNVSATPMGKYQSTISRAVELAWQRNCVKHRDFITPGYLTVRFFIGEKGQVKFINSIGEELTGEIQKGFTFSAIREAKIPPMPAAVKKEMAGDALEIVFRFNF